MVLPLFFEEMAGMTGEDDLLKNEDEQVEADSSEESTQESGETTEAIADEEIASGEVRAVEAPKTEGKGALLLGLLLLVVLLGGAFFLINGSVTSKTPQLGVDTDQPVPKRYSIDAVSEEVITTKQVAAVGVASQSKAETTPAEETAVITKVQQKSAPVDVVKTKNEAADSVSKAEAKTASAAGAMVGGLYQVQVGPYLYVVDTKNAAAKLKKLGYQTQKVDGKGPVAMVRLLEGTYPAPEARNHLTEIKQKVADAFLLPSGDKLGVYVGSFSNRKRADRYAKKLAEQGVAVTPVVSKVEMNGKLFIVAEAELIKARNIAAKMMAAGFTAQVVKK